MVCPSCGVALLEGPERSNGKPHVCKCCKHTWETEHGCIANPLASLRPYLSSEGAMVFESARAWECVSAKQFDKIARVSTVYLALVEQVGDLNFTHRSAHGGQAHEAKFEGSQELLNELKAAHP